MNLRFEQQWYKHGNRTVGGIYVRTYEGYVRMVSGELDPDPWVERVRLHETKFPLDW